MTKIGDDGRAILERHITDHNQPNAHSNPHDHPISWPNGKPDFSDGINYRFGNIPEFKGFRKEYKSMTEHEDYSLNFESISDYKWSMSCGPEVVFEWKGQRYCFFAKVKRESDGKVMPMISEVYSDELVWCETYDDVLEYRLRDGSRLRDIITQVTVLDRTI